MAVICERSPRGPLTPHALDQLKAVYDFVKGALNHHPGMERNAVCNYHCII